MPKNLTPAEQLQHVTSVIETDSGNGTGFIFNLYQDSSKSFPTIVTNRHVIENCTKSAFYLTSADKNGDAEFGQRIKYELPKNAWRNHPNPEVDLAMAAIGGALANAQSGGLIPFYRSLDQSIVADQTYLSDMDAIENIVMIGYPIGIYDQVNNLPVMRRGMTASRIGLDYNGKPEFLIDCACFPGSSGSPIFQYDTGPKLNRGGGMEMGGVRLKFLGILWGGPTYDADGEIIAIPIQTNTKSVSITKVMTNLGYCVKATALDKFKQVFSKELAASGIKIS